MDRIIQSPGKYIQGANAITRLGNYLKPLAERWLIVGDKFGWVLPKKSCEKAWPMRVWLLKSCRLAVNARIMKSIAYEKSPARPAAMPCWESAAEKRWIPRKH